ncbi:MAG: Do family serine endopeptidase [Pseudomonadota bacterium]
MVLGSRLRAKRGGVEPGLGEHAVAPGRRRSASFLCGLLNRVGIVVGCCLVLGLGVGLGVGLGLSQTLTTEATAASPGGLAGERQFANDSSSRQPFDARPLLLEQAFVPIVARASSAVVSISTVKLLKTAPAEESPSVLEPWLRRLPEPEPKERRTRGLGSGIIVSSDGYVLTNNHLVEGATKVGVTLADGRALVAKVVGTDSPTDLAVIHVAATDLPTVVFGDSAAMRIGDFAIAFGNPFGLGQTVTAGIISAVGRGNVGISDYEDFLQTDAAINPGNSGGALVNHRGELIGISTAIVSSGSPGNQGIGFAVPSNMAKGVMEQIIRTGKVVRGWLGVSIQDLTPSLAGALGIGDRRGALVSDTTPGSPAEAAGIKQGDVIVELDGQAVAKSSELRNRIAATPPGTRVTLAIERARGERRELLVELKELPSGAMPKQPRPEKEKEQQQQLGLQVATLSPDVARQLGLPPDTGGVVVVKVVPVSPAAEAGFRVGDVIREIDRRPVGSPSEVQRFIDKEGDKPLLFLVIRAGTVLFVVVEKG